MAGCDRRPCYRGRHRVLAFTLLAFAACETQNASQRSEGRSRELEEALARLGAGETAAGLAFDLPAHELFGIDSHRVSPAGAEILRTVAIVLRAYPTAQVLIDGHTDATGPREYNRAVSARLAEAVKTWLVEKQGIDGALITARGMGEEQPVAPNDREEGRRKNRRISVVVALAQ